MTKQADAPTPHTETLQTCNMNKHATKTLQKQKKYTPVLKYNFKKFQEKTDFPEYTKNIFSTKLLTSISLKHTLTVSRQSLGGKGGNVFGGTEAYPFDATSSVVVLLS